jgi:hypothetical protein
MKKLIFAATLLFVSVFAKAQEGDKTQKKCEFFAMLTLGLNYSGIGGESDSYSGGLFGGFFGIGTDFFCINAHFSVGGELAFSQQGSKYESSDYVPGGETINSKASVRLNYLVLPVTAKYKTDKGFMGEAGVQPGLLLSAKDKHDGESEDLKDYYNGFDMGVVLGAGYRAPKSKIGVSLRFVQGLTNINKDEGMYSVKDHNWNASLRFSYHL